MQSLTAQISENEPTPVEIDFLNIIAQRLDEWTDRLCARTDVLLQNHEFTSEKQKKVEEQRAA